MESYGNPKEHHKLWEQQPLCIRHQIYLQLYIEIKRVQIGTMTLLGMVVSEDIDDILNQEETIYYW